MYTYEKTSIGVVPRPVYIHLYILLCERGLLSNAVFPTHRHRHRHTHTHRHRHRHRQRETHTQPLYMCVDFSYIFERGALPCLAAMDTHTHTHTHTPLPASL